MNEGRKTFALALLTSTTVALAGCSADAQVDPSSEEASALQTFSSIGKDGGCASTAPGRDHFFSGSHVRVRFVDGSRGDVVVVESYDARTGYVERADEYFYERKSSSELALYHLASAGERMPDYRLVLDSRGSGGQLLDDGYRAEGSLPLECDLRQGAPSLELPVTPKVAEAKTVSEFPRFPSGGTTGCTATKAVDGRPFRVRMIRDRVPGGDFEWVSAFDLHDARSHFAEDLLGGKFNKMLDDVDHFTIVDLDSNDTLAEIAIKTIGGKKQLALVPKKAKLREALGAAVPLRCDFRDE